jgi:hypothetical protein
MPRVVALAAAALALAVADRWLFTYAPNPLRSVVTAGTPSAMHSIGV